MPNHSLPHSKLWLPLKSGSLYPFAAGATLASIVVPVATGPRGRQLSVTGTAFCISRLSSGEAIFVTARHVLEGSDRGDIAAIVSLPKAVGRSVELLPMEYVSYSEQNSDVAIFVVELPGDSHSRSESTRLSLSLAKPRLGERCVALGYPQMSGLVGRFNRNLVFSDGLIDEVHHSQRDRSFVNFPSFRTGALFLPGMSGGPILNKEGDVIGVVSTGTDGVGVGEDGLSYGACILAVAELSVEIHDEEGVQHTTRLGELIARGLADASHGRVRVQRDASGIALQWEDDFA